MKTTKQLKFKGSKKLTALLVRENKEGSKLILCLDNINEVTGQRDGCGSCETPIEIKKENYYGYMSDHKGTAEIHSINLHAQIKTFDICHIKTALKSISKDSEIYIKAVLFNNSDNIIKVEFNRHDFYLIVDGKTFLLETFVGPDNSASPVQYSIIK